MGRHKEWELKKEERWDNKARANNYVCRWHGGPIEYNDRLVYFMTGSCSYCHHIMMKDD